MINLILKLSDKYLFVNNYMEKLLQAFISRKKKPFASIEMQRMQREQACRDELLKINQFSKYGIASGVPEPRVAPQIKR